MFWRRKNSSESQNQPTEKKNLGASIRSVFSRVKFDLEDLDSLEDVLIQADFGVDAAADLVAELKSRAKRQAVSSELELRELLASILIERLTRGDSELNLEEAELPKVILVVGVNGAGKTTTIGKLANYLTKSGAKVTIAAADTFRAAAVDQLATWADRAGAKLIAAESGADPASVAFQAVATGIAENTDVIIIDTAGRLQNKQGLMDELAKIKRIVEKQLVVDETLLVIDATTGQNALGQAKAFTDVAKVTGLVLTKLDGSAKGGIVYAIQRELDIPVKLIGVGEGIDDFGFFEPKDFVGGLLGQI
ncbi:MAG: signal recognition particle-docking protein FtsY [Actinobacteria bacterium]|nr:signal recognition particle-docking protein FtsY [Actinomycetota bacterium]